MNITKRTVDALAPKPKRYFVWDGVLKGFGIRIEPRGRKTFLCRYRFNGARRQYLIGSTTSLTADQARTEARRVLSAAVLGQDHAQARYDTRRTIRFDALVDAFLAGHAAKLKPGTYLDYSCALAKHAVPALGRTPADAVTAAQLNRLHLSLGDRRVRANRVITYIGSLFS